MIPSLVPQDIAKDMTKVMQKIWQAHSFVAYQVIALVALEKDSRAGGPNFQYAVEERQKAWNTASKAWAELEDLNTETRMALWIFTWLSTITDIEMAHHKTTGGLNFAIQTSRALEIGAKLHYALMPFIKDMFLNEGFKSLLKVKAVPFTEAALQAETIVKAMYKVIEGYGMDQLGDVYPVVCGDSEKLAVGAAKILKRVQHHKKMTDPRSILLWVATADLNDRSWDALRIKSKQADQHELWWLLLANWAVSCHYMRHQIWYLDGVGKKIMDAVVEVLKKRGLDKENHWPEAMAQVLLALKQN